MSQSTSRIKVGPVTDLKRDSPTVIQRDGSAIALFYHEDSFFATDLRCPHMGFPLTDGTIEDGLLTCPWHHARFELSCGDTLDPFADDVHTYPVEIEDQTVYINPDPVQERSPTEHWQKRLTHGLQENLSLIIAKATLGLMDADESYTVPLRLGVEFGTTYRAHGWGRGLTTLGVMANLYHDVRPVDRSRALYQGLGSVADNSAGEPPFFGQEPLQAQDLELGRLISWFRENIDVRDADGAERILRAAIQAGHSEDALATMLVGAATDHLYLDTGHRLDFINKAFEMLDHIGWEYADQVLPSLVPGLAAASRAEESSSWRQPIDIAELCFDAATSLPDLVKKGQGQSWQEPDLFIKELLSDDPHEIINSLTSAIAAGAKAETLAQCVSLAAATRIVQFGTSNEFRDWNTVHHTFTYANAVHGMSRRTDNPVVYRGVFDAAMNVYLDRFLNTPPTPIPTPNGGGNPDKLLEDLRDTFTIESPGEINRAGELTAAYLSSGGDIPTLKKTLGQALLREDVGFHTRQNLEAAFSQVASTDRTERSRIHLIATARYLSAHTPTRRAGEQTFQIAERLHRGEQIHEP